MKNHKLIYLKVKIKSLQEEAKIIRKFEKKYKKDDVLRNGLCEHRKGIVRDEQFHTFIAYGFLRGRSFRSIAPNLERKYSHTRVLEMCWKYGTSDWREDVDRKLKEWYKE